MRLPQGKHLLCKNQFAAGVSFAQIWSMKRLFLFILLVNCSWMSAQTARPTLAFMGLPRLEMSSDFQSFSLYGGYGFYTTYFVIGNIGYEARFSPDGFLNGPKASLGWTFVSQPGFQVTCSAFMPIKDKQVDVILNPQIGTNIFLGIFYLEGGYNFNLTRNTPIPDSFNMTLGMQIPLNIEKFVNNI